MASRFWVGGTGDWDAADTTHWAATSGGAGGETVPTTSDTVTFDSNSGATATVTITGGTANASNVTINKSDLTLLHNDISNFTGLVLLTTGAVNTNGFNCAWGRFDSNNGNTRSITLSTSIITTSVSGQTSWNVNSASGLTLSAASSTIICNGGNAFTVTSGQNYGTVTVNVPSATTFAWQGAGNYGALTLTASASKTCIFSSSTNITVTGTFTANGNSITNRLLVQSSAVASARTITAATVSVTHSDFMDITGAGAGSWDLSAITGGSGDCGGNTSITFTTAATQTYTGGTDNWSTAAKWTSRVPLPQDDVLMSGVTGGTITADMPRAGKSIDWTGASGTPAFAISVAIAIFGSVTFISDMTVSGSGAVTFSGRSSFTLTSAGKSYPSSTVISAPSGTYTLSDSFSCVGTWTQSAGTFTASTFNMTASTFTTSATGTKTLNMGSGTWTPTNTSAVTIFSVNGTGGLTFNCQTSTIHIPTGGSTRTLAGNGQTFNVLTYTVSGSTGAFVITGSNTFNTINFSDASNARTLQFTASTTTTVTNWNVFGTSGKLVTISSVTAATHTLSKASGIVSSDYLHLTNSIAQGGATWYAGANSTDNGGNTGWLFESAPSTATSGDGKGAGSIKALQNLLNLRVI